MNMAERPRLGSLRKSQKEMFRTTERWVRDVVEGNAVAKWRLDPVESDSDAETFDRLRRLGLVVATMGSGKTLEIVLELLAQTPVSLSSRTMDKRLIMCYNINAVKNFVDVVDELQFEQRCPLHTRKGSCEQCTKAQDLAIGKSKLVRIIGLDPTQVKELSQRVYFLKTDAKDVTNPDSMSEEALKFRRAWIVISTQQIWKTEYLKQMPAINLASWPSESTPDETAHKFLAYAATLLSKQVPAGTVSLDLPTVDFSASSLTN